MKIGFTGTRKGMTWQQADALVSLLHLVVLSEFHQGDCIGADAEALKLATTVDPECDTHCHPPTNKKLRAFTQCNYTHPEKPYMARNRDIVDASDLMYACPDGPEREGSGTWRTINYAADAGKVVAIIWPDGAVEEREPRKAA